MALGTSTSTLSPWLLWLACSLSSTASKSTKPVTRVKRGGSDAGGGIIDEHGAVDSLSMALESWSVSITWVSALSPTTPDNKN